MIDTRIPRINKWDSPKFQLNTDIFQSINVNLSASILQVPVVMGSALILERKQKRGDSEGRFEKYLVKRDEEHTGQVIKAGSLIPKKRSASQQNHTPLLKQVLLQVRLVKEFLKEKRKREEKEEREREEQAQLIQTKPLVFPNREKGSNKNEDILKTINQYPDRPKSSQRSTTQSQQQQQQLKRIYSGRLHPSRNILKSTTPPVATAATTASEIVIVPTKITYRYDEQEEFDTDSDNNQRGNTSALFNASSKDSTLTKDNKLRGRKYLERLQQPIKHMSYINTNELMQGVLQQRPLAAATTNNIGGENCDDQMEPKYFHKRTVIRSRLQVQN